MALLMHRSPAVVIFDGDDTLWTTEPLYDDARSQAGAIVATSGLDARAWEALERQLDVENVETFGYNSERFPTSCVQAYAELCRRNALSPDPSISERIRRAALTVFDRDPPVVQGARETLAWLRGSGIRLALLTKGEPRIQARRIASSGLRECFDIIRIVQEKSPETFQALVAALGVDVGRAWMVGNSVRSDILPATAAGLQAVWIDAHVWEHEQAFRLPEQHRVISIAKLTDLPRIIPR